MVSRWDADPGRGAAVRVPDPQSLYEPLGHRNPRADSVLTPHYDSADLAIAVPGEQPRTAPHACLCLGHVGCWGLCQSGQPALSCPGSVLSPARLPVCVGRPLSLPAPTPWVSIVPARWDLPVSAARALGLAWIHPSGSVLWGTLPPVSSLDPTVPCHHAPALLSMLPFQQPGPGLQSEIRSRVAGPVSLDAGSEAGLLPVDE